MDIDKLLDGIVVVTERQHLIDQEHEGEVTGRLLKIWFNLELLLILI